MLQSDLLDQHNPDDSRPQQTYVECRTNDIQTRPVDLPRYRAACELLDAALAMNPKLRAPDADELAQLAELDPAYPVAHAFRVSRNLNQFTQAAEAAHGGAHFIVGVDCPLCGLQHIHGAYRDAGATITHTHRMAHCTPRRGVYHVRIDWRSVAHTKSGKSWPRRRRRPRKGFKPWTPVDGGAL